MPETSEFLPKPSKGKLGGSWFGRGGGKTEEEVERETERVTGRVRRTRRMGKNEGVAGPIPVPASGEVGGQVPLADPLD
jgi:hypothetical protein